MVRCQIQEYQSNKRKFVLRFKESVRQFTCYQVFPTPFLEGDECRVLFRYDAKQESFLWGAVLISMDFYQNFILKGVNYHA